MLIEKRILGSVAYVGLGARPEAFLWSWGSMIQFTNEYMLRPGEIVHWMRGSQPNQIGARNYLAATMLGEWLLMLDTDHAFEPDLLYRMLQVFNAGDLDVLTGVYTYKTFPHRPVLYGYSEKRDGYEHIIDLKKYGPKDVIQIACAGAGTLLIRRRVLEQIAATNEKPFSHCGRYDGDDFNFFERIRLMGIKSWCCPAIQTYHLRESETSLDDYNESEMVVGEQVAVPTIYTPTRPT